VIIIRIIRKLVGKFDDDPAAEECVCRVPCFRQFVRGIDECGCIPELKRWFIFLFGLDLVAASQLLENPCVLQGFLTEIRVDICQFSVQGCPCILIVHQPMK